MFAYLMSGGENEVPTIVTFNLLFQSDPENFTGDVSVARSCAWSLELGVRRTGCPTPSPFGDGSASFSPVVSLQT